MVSLLFSGCSDSEELELLEREVISLEKNLETRNSKVTEVENLLESMVEEKHETEELLKISEKTVEDLERKINKSNVSPRLENSDKLNDAIKILSVSDKGFSYIMSDSEDSIYSVNIVGSNASIVEEFERLELDAPGTGEVLKVQVIGSVYDFQIFEVEYTDSVNDLKEIRVLDEYSEISNKIILVDTYLTCGIPRGKLKWKNKDGKVFHYYLSQDGYGFSGDVIWCK